MKELVKQFLDQGISRRKLVTGLTAIGMTSVAAKAMAQNLSPPAGGVVQGASREMHGWTLGGRFRQMAAGGRVKWRFPTADARIKLRQLYPSSEP